MVCFDCQAAPAVYARQYDAAEPGPGRCAECDRAHVRALRVFSSNPDPGRRVGVRIGR